MGFPVEGFDGGAQARVVNFGTMLRNASADESSYDAAGSRPRAGVSPFKLGRVDKKEASGRPQPTDSQQAVRL